MSLVRGPEFGRLFDECRHTAWRLEVRERYSSAHEDGPFMDWQAGRQPDMQWLAPWLDKMKVATSTGKRIERVRLVPEPLTKYLRWEHWTCQFNIEAGEDIRYLPRSSAPDLPNHDFWLFDSSILGILRFDDHDRFLGLELITDPATIVRHNFYRDGAWHHAIPYNNYRPD